MRSLIIALLLISISSFSQDEKRGTIKVKKKTVERYSSDSIISEGYASIVEVSKVIKKIKPQYPGGDKEIKKFVSSTIKYPDQITDKKNNGICYTSFTVNQDGKLSDIKIVRKVIGCPECDQEAIRVLKLMKPWQPGTEDGKIVPMRTDLAIVFQVK